MLGIWGKHAVNPEYNALRKKYPNLASSQFYLKSEPFKIIESTKK
jgi:N-sulfoglucosamine sulfohydrolase